MSIDTCKIIGDAIRPVFEDVEARTMMSVAELDGHMLKIETTDADDRIAVMVSDDGSQMFATVNGETSEPIAARQVYTMAIDAGGGDNHVYIDPRISANVRVTTGSGRDVIYTGSGHDVIESGSGNDIIDAGAGNDSVYGGSGNDKINGGSGNDTLSGGDGKDSISGDGGSDKIYGRRGNDKLYGDADDYIAGDAGRNMISKRSSIAIRNDGFVPPKITSISVIDADTGKGVSGYERLTADTTLDPTRLPARYTIIAEAEDGVQSVYFQTADNSLFRRDNGREFSMTNPSSEGVYQAWNPTAGKTYTLNVVPNTAPNLSGFIGDTFTIKLTVKSASTSTGGTSTTGSGSSGNVTTVNPLAPKIKFTKIAEGATAGQQFAIEATGTTVPGHQVEDAKFEWNFGDPAGKYNTLPGFNAAHVYERPGTYTVTLTVTAPGGHVSKATTIVNVAASNYKTIYVAANGNDANDGSSQSKPVRTLVRASQLIEDNTKVLLRRGDTFGMTVGMTIENDNVILSTYGNGRSPIVRYEGARKMIMMVGVASQATNTLIENLTFTSIYDRDTEQANMAHGIHSAGKLTTVRNNTFLHLGYALNNNGSPNGMFIYDNAAPDPKGLRGYFSWTQGKNFVIVGNEVANSTREHNIRISEATNVSIAYNTLANIDRGDNGDAKDFSKGTITQQRGLYSYIAYNKLTDGDLGVGPLGGGDGPKIADALLWHVAVEGNVVRDAAIKVYHGSHGITVRDNIVDRDNDYAFLIDGWNNDFNRGTSDVVLDHNLAVNNGAYGNFLWVMAHVDGITMTNNVYVAPKLSPGSGTGALRIDENSLSSFSRIDNNIWPTADRGSRWANGGLFMVGTQIVSSSYMTLSNWNSRSQVGDDRSEDVGEFNAMKITPSMLSKAA